jgi:hypothetical protein
MATNSGSHRSGDGALARLLRAECRKGTLEMLGLSIPNRLSVSRQPPFPSAVFVFYGRLEIFFDEGVPSYCCTAEDLVPAVRSP